MTRRFSWVLALFCGGAALLASSGLRAGTDGAQPEGSKPPVRMIQGVHVVGFGEKKEISSEQELAKMFDAKDQARIKEQVDFTKEKILLVTWTGSSSSWLTFAIKQEKGKVKVVVAIHTANPAFADNRLHGGMIVMPRDAVWEFGQVESLLPGAAGKQAAISLDR
jgi:hypothetical protein